MNWVRCIAMHLSHTKTLVLAGTMTERAFHSSLPRRIEGKNPTLFCVGAIIANYLLNFFYAISTYGS